MRHLRGFSARDRAIILDAVLRQLSHAPAMPTRNRMHVYFEVQEALALVTVRAIGVKVRERVLIGGVEVDLR